MVLRLLSPLLIQRGAPDLPASVLRIAMRAVHLSVELAS